VRWNEPAWRAEARAWIREATERLGYELTGPLEDERVKPWAAVLRVPTDHGQLFFKAMVPSLAHEGRVIEAVARRRADAVTEVLSLDPASGWMLMRDAGASLERLDDHDALEHWESALPAYAQLQIDVTDAAMDIAELYPLDRRTPRLPGLLAEVLEDAAVLAVGEADGLTVDERDRIRSVVPGIGARCAELVASPIGDTIQNDDLASSSVFTSPEGYRFVDWGDSCVAFPFFTLTITLRAIAYLYGLPAGDSRLDRLRDAYLEPWTRYETRRELLRLDRIARPIGQACRAVWWYDAVRSGAWEEDRDTTPWALRLIVDPEAWRMPTD
jgi:hypothetical protein